MQDETAYNSLIFWGGSTIGATATPAGKYPTLVICYNSIVPLNIIDFVGQLKNKNVELSWRTTNEVNTSHVEIERSYSMDKFNTISKLITNNNGSASFTFIDKEAYSNNGPIAYYRLKFVDKDGSFTFSKTIAINLSNNAINTFNVKGNPVNEKLSLNIYSSNNGNTILQINDITGKSILTETLKTEKGLQIIDKNISGLKAGLYYVSLIWNNEKITQKIIKL